MVNPGITVALTIVFLIVLVTYNRDAFEPFVQAIPSSFNSVYLDRENLLDNRKIKSNAVASTKVPGYNANQPFKHTGKSMAPTNTTARFTDYNTDQTEIDQVKKSMARLKEYALRDEPGSETNFKRHYYQYEA